MRLSARNWPNLHLKHYSFSISDGCRTILEGDSIVDSDISDGIIEISSMFKILYTDANVLICWILSPDCYWLINGVYIKDVNEFFKWKYVQFLFSYITQGNNWTLVHCYLNPKFSFSEKTTYIYMQKHFKHQPLSVNKIT